MGERKVMAHSHEGNDEAIECVRIDDFDGSR